MIEIIQLENGKIYNLNSGQYDLVNPHIILPLPKDEMTILLFWVRTFEKDDLISLLTWFLNDMFYFISVNRTAKTKILVSHVELY